MNNSIFEMIYNRLGEENAFENLEVIKFEKILKDKYIDFSDDDAYDIFCGFSNAIEQQAFKVGLKTAFSLMFNDI